MENERSTVVLIPFDKIIHLYQPIQMTVTKIMDLGLC